MSLVCYMSMVPTMYCMPNFFISQRSSVRDKKRKEARYELASLLTNERFKEAVHLADSYLVSNVIRPEDHAFVIEIAFVAEALTPEYGG